ncbi:MAG: T9SS type A sorting domain-containing protein [Chitinophagales bacterium]
MKKSLLLFFLLFVLYGLKAQYIYLQEISNFTYDIGSLGDYNNRYIAVVDSFVYCVRSGGIEGLNVSTNERTYSYKNSNGVTFLRNDYQGHYAYLASNSYYRGIFKYDSAGETYKNITQGTLADVTAFDISPHDNLWAVTTNKCITRYVGGNWQSTCIVPGSPGDYYSDVKAVDSNTCYLRDGNNRIFRFSISGLDTLIGYSSVFKDWAVDSTGTLWIAKRDTLLAVKNSIIKHIPAGLLPGGAQKFLHVACLANGKVITAGADSCFFIYDGLNWQRVNLPALKHGILNVTVGDSTVYIVEGQSSQQNEAGSLFVIKDTAIVQKDFRYYPFDNVKALSSDFFATEQGIFQMKFMYPPKVEAVYDTLPDEIIADATCFRVNQTYYTSNWFPEEIGSESGMILSLVADSLLSNLHVNTFFKDDWNMRYYIGTDSGLTVYDGAYYYFTMANSPLPSNKITSLRVGYHSNSGIVQNVLYVGTDKGLAILRDSIWTVYDSSKIALNDLYITGIYASDYMGWHDTSIIVATRGSGLVFIGPSGTIQYKNTTNDELADDSLNYIVNYQLGKCGEGLAIGTQHHGIIIYDPWYLNQFYYDTVVTTWPSTEYFHTSRVGQMGSQGVYLQADNHILWATPCGGIEDYGSKEEALLWHQDKGKLLLEYKDGSVFGAGQLALFDLLGRVVCSKKLDSEHQQALDVSALPSGVYLAEVVSKGQKSVVKVFLY